MGKLIHTDHTVFDLTDWESEDLQKVFAGTGCVMALTADGRVLQKIMSPEHAARTDYWKNITDIALSNWMDGLAIGLCSDGTCMISKRPARKLWSDPSAFERINSTVKSWKNIVAVAASDAFFALDRDGYVHYAADRAVDYYRETKSWKNIVRMVTGTQCSLFGITADGRVYAAGPNCTAGPAGNIRDKLDRMTDIVDLCVSGSECSQIYVAHRDGRVEDVISGEILDFTCRPKPGCMQSHTVAVAIQQADGSVKHLSYCCGPLSGAEAFSQTPVSSFALGDGDYILTFMLGIV